MNEASEGRTEPPSPTDSPRSWEFEVRPIPTLRSNTSRRTQDDVSSCYRYESNINYKNSILESRSEAATNSVYTYETTESARNHRLGQRQQNPPSLYEIPEDVTTSSSSYDKEIMAALDHLTPPPLDMTDESGSEVLHGVAHLEDSDSEDLNMASPLYFQSEANDDESNNARLHLQMS